MSEIAEMMLDGFMCEQCGEIIGDMETGEGQGYPGLCAGCAMRNRPPEPDSERSRPRKRQRTHECPVCHKGYRDEQGVRDHMRVKHASPTP